MHWIIRIFILNAIFINHNAAYLHSEKNMPASLNALIRYRTIDNCLSNPYRKWTIGDLVDACSNALKEHRGIYAGISERTIREDIRIMRSDILGFNAPIVQSGGHYTYEDREYSIFKVNIKDSGLLARVLDFILEIQSEINHPEMEKIIESITDAISNTRDTEVYNANMNILQDMASEISEPDVNESFQPMPQVDGPDLIWAGILNIINPDRK